MGFRPLDTVHFPTMPRRRLDLVGTTEIAELLGTSRQYANELANRDDFPTPAADLRQGRVWYRDEVQAFLAKRQRPPRPEPPRADPA